MNKLLRVGLAVLFAAASCRQEQEPGPPDRAPKDVKPKPADVLLFPAELRVADASVNTFVEDAMKVCARGDYQAFRLLWSAREEPLPKDEFEQGWKAVQKIDIRALREARLAEGSQPGADPAQTVYILWADVSFDPAHPAGQREPTRQAVLMLVRESDAWRLARAPKAMRDWIKDQAQRSGFLP